MNPSAKTSCAAVAVVALALALTSEAAGPLPRTAAQAATARAKLAGLIWPDGKLPVVRPRELGDTLIVDLPAGLTSTATVVRPARPNGRALIWHNGHEDANPTGPSVARTAAAHGYLTVVLDLPMYGRNFWRPPINPDGTYTDDVTLAAEQCGGLPRRFGTHEVLACYDHPLQLFITPVVAVVSWLRDHDYRQIRMAGLSGGGWATVVAAAADTRISRSYPVAGTQAGSVWWRHCRLGRVTRVCSFDFEQREVLHAFRDYDALYVLGAHGSGRSQTAIYNLHDPVAFGGGDTSWTPRVRAAVRAIGAGGSYAALVDRRQRAHALSPRMLRRVLLP